MGIVALAYVFYGRNLSKWTTTTRIYAILDRLVFGDCRKHHINDLDI